MYIANNIKYLRTIKNLSQEELGKAVDIKQPQIGAYERGASLPRFTGLLKLCEFFQVSADDLIWKNLEAGEKPDGWLAVQDKAKINELQALRIRELEREILQLNPEEAAKLGIVEKNEGDE